jgi:hypothetical protein
MNIFQGDIQGKLIPFMVRQAYHERYQHLAFITRLGSEVFSFGQPLAKSNHEKDY